MIIMMSEMWKTILGYEGRYMVSTEGRVYSMLTDAGRRAKGRV